jgi:hypothetical protein
MPQFLHITKPISPEYEPLFSQYYQLRVEAFNRVLGGSIYSAEPGQIDLMDDTSYYFMTTDDGTTLLAALRVHPQPANSARRCWFEENYREELSLEKFFPHDDIRTFGFIEGGGAAAANGHGKEHYGQQLFAHVLQNMPKDYPDAAFMTGITNPFSFKAMLKASMRAAAPVWYMHDQTTPDKNLDTTLKLIFCPLNSQGLELLQRNIGLQRGDTRSYTLENPQWR